MVRITNIYELLNKYGSLKSSLLLLHQTKLDSWTRNMKHLDSCASLFLGIFFSISRYWRLQRKFGTNWKPCMESRMIWEYTSLRMSWCISSLPISRPWMTVSQSSSTMSYCWSNVRWRRRMISSSSPYSPNLELIICFLSLHFMWGSLQPLNGIFFHSMPSLIP